jgi:Ca-activated chloride channel family protein
LPVHSFWVAVAITTLGAASVAQQSVPPSAALDKGFTFNVSVGEVLVHATVRNKKGSPVAGLGKENFQIFEDHVLQPIKHFSHEDIPVTVGLVIDNSGSMRTKRPEVISAALAFASSSNSRDQMFLVNFNEHVSLGLPSTQPFTDKPDELRAAMATVKSNGKTALFDAVALALGHLKKGDKDKRVLIVVSDGADNASVRTKEQILEMASRSDAIIYAIGIYDPEDPDRSPKVLSEMAKATGGEAFFPATLKEVLPVCEKIAHDIRNQYTLSYTPANPKQDGAFRAIQVRAGEVNGHGYFVTTRSGYVAPLHPASAVLGTAKPEARN